MGTNFWCNTTIWTILCMVQVYTSGGRQQEDPQDIGLDSPSDDTKINISQKEYTKMMRTYLQAVQAASYSPSQATELVTFYLDESTWRRHHGGVLLFDISPSSLPTGEVEEAELRVLFPNFVDEAVELSVYQYLGPHNKRYILDKRTTYLSSHSTKWCSFDISGAVTAWIAGVRNFGLQIECSFCGAFLQPLEAYVNVLAAPRGRFRRSSPLQKYDERGRTDCKNSSDGNRKCCRHKMTVTFKDLNVPQVSSIIQPKSYEAFYCKGRCPVNYNHATNHSRIQNLVHRMDKKVIPRVCCAPSKLEPLEILRVDPYNTDKLVLERWDNMRVLECACS